MHRFKTAILSGAYDDNNKNNSNSNEDLNNTYDNDITCNSNIEKKSDLKELKLSTYLNFTRNTLGLFDAYQRVADPGTVVYCAGVYICIYAYV
jgi:hypothetical protein